MSPNNREDPSTEQDVTYNCGICDVGYCSEVLTRTHITLCEDDEHSTYHGFMPESKVEILDEDGCSIREKRGKGNKNIRDITPDKLPDNISEVDKHIITTTVNSAEVDTYQELVDRTNGSLRARGIEERSYTTIVNKIKDFFNLNENNDISFENLSEKQKRVLNVYKNNRDISVTELAKEASVDKSYPNQVIAKYGHLLEEENQPTNISDQNDENTEKTVEELIESSYNSELYDGVKVTEKKRAIIEYVSRNPNATNKDVSNYVGCSVSYSSNVRNDFQRLIQARSEELDITNVSEREEEIENKRKEKSWDELTEKQQEVLLRISEEEHLNSNDLDFKSVLDDLPFHTHVSYVSSTYEKYNHHAIRLKQAKKYTEKTDIDYTEIIDEVPLINESIESISELQEFILETSSNSNNTEVSTGKKIMANQFKSELNNISA